MFGRLRASLTFANVISVVALIAALGVGTAWALERNSVKSKHIVNEQVRNKDLASDAVTSPKVANGSLDLQDIANSAQSTFYSGLDFSAEECKDLELGSTAMADDAAVLVLPDRQNGTRSWDSRIVLDAYGPRGPAAWEEMVTGPAPVVRVCNRSDDVIEDVDLPFYMLGFKGP